MNAFVLFLVLLKATLTSFAGLASISVVRDELVIQRQVLTDEQLTQAVMVTRTTPGPVGLYLVSVGYFVAGVPGAIAGWAAMIAPALLIIPLLVLLRRDSTHPRIQNAIKFIVCASAGLLLVTAIPLAQYAITDAITLGIAVLTILILLKSNIDTLWIIAGAMVISLVASLFAIV